MKIFQFIKKIFAGGGQGVGLDMGVETHHDAFSLSQTQNLGTETESMNFAFAPTIATGIETESMDISSTGQAVFPQGEETETDRFTGAISLSYNPSISTPTPDSTGNSRHGYLSGTTPPSLVTSPWPGFGNALDFPGTDADENSSGVNCGTGLTRTGDFTVECKFRADVLPDATTAATMLVSTWDESSTDAGSHRNFILYIAWDGTKAILIGSIANSTGGEAFINTGTTALVAGTLYDAALVRTGTQMRLYLNGVLEGTPITVTIPNTPASGTEFWIGRESRKFGAGSVNTSWPYPINGVIEEVRMSNSARYTGASYTPSAAPFTTDVNTIGLWHFDAITETYNTLFLESESMVVSAVANISQFTSSATAIQNSGTPNWTSPTNVQGAINGTEASHAGLSGVLSACDATLRCVLPSIGVVPPGFAAGQYFIRVVHRWDLDILLPVAGIVDAVNVIELRTNANVLIAVLNTRSAAGVGGTQATLLTEDFNITSLTTAAQRAAGLRVDFHVTCNYVPVVNGDTSWQVDACHLVTSYSRSGIN